MHVYIHPYYCIKHTDQVVNPGLIALKDLLYEETWGVLQTCVCVCRIGVQNECTKAQLCHTRTYTPILSPRLPPGTFLGIDDSRGCPFTSAMLEPTKR